MKMNDRAADKAQDHPISEDEHAKVAIPIDLFAIRKDQLNT